MTVSDVATQPATPPGTSGLRRLRIDLSYDGTDFSGWARQPGRRTVQEVVEDALSTVLQLDPPASLIVAGRTDSGVHASGQVAHLDVATMPDDLPGLLRNLNSILPDDVVVTDLTAVSSDFNARFSALGRRYEYRVTDGIPDPLRRRDTVSRTHALDVRKMQEAANTLVGLHNFAAYCKPRAGATTIRTLHELVVTRTGDVIVMVAHADAFCHGQVRSMVGALLAVGEGHRPVDWPAELLTKDRREHKVHVAPAHGLRLVEVDYPPDEELAARAELTRQRRIATEKSLFIRPSSG